MTVKNKFSRYIVLLLSLVICIQSVLPAAGTENAETSEYTGDVIYIDDMEDLLVLAHNCSLDIWSQGKTVVLRNDIRISGSGFMPIPLFGGVFDGNGHTISGLQIDDSVAPAGLISILQEGAVIKNLRVEGVVEPCGSAETVGGITGENRGIIENCSFSGDVTGTSYTGGIVGTNAETGKISGCTSEGTVTGDNQTGGIAGCNMGVVENCVNKGEVNTSVVDPGLKLEDIDVNLSQDISKLYSMDTSSAAMDTGGIAGYSTGIIEKCRNDETIGYPHIGYNVGGIVGRSCGYIGECTNNAEIYGRKDVGGIAGQLEPYIALNFTEDTFAALRQQLNDLNNMVNSALNGMGSGMRSITDQLNDIADYVDTAAQALDDIQTETTINSNIEGGQDTSGSGSATVTLPGMELDGKVNTDGEGSRILNPPELEISVGTDEGTETDTGAGLETTDGGVKTSSSEDLPASEEKGAAEITEINEIPEYSQPAAAEEEIAGVGADMILQEDITVQEPVQEPTQETVQEPTQETVQESMQEPGTGEGSMDFSGDLIIEDDTSLEVEISGDNPGALISGEDISVNVTPPSVDSGGNITSSGNLQAGSTPGTVTGSANTSTDGKMNAITNITLVTPMSQLAAAVSGMTGQMKLLNDAIFGATGGMTDDLRAISNQINVIANTVFGTMLGMESQSDEDMVSDTSNIDIDMVTYGKAISCENGGYVDGDLCVGGIAGAMAVEYELDPEDDVTSNISGMQRRRYELKAIIQKCRNTGSVNAKRSYAGNICGRMDLGLIIDSEGYGKVKSEGGDYVGGIAGSTGGTIRRCYAKCTLEGRKYVGGIVGDGVRTDVSGSGSIVENCYSHVTISNAEQYTGAISGENSGTFTENYFVSDTLAGINRMSYHGQAEPIVYQELEELETSPDSFRQLTLTFVADDEVIKTVPFRYGESFDQSVYPEIPEKEGYYAKWDKSKLETLCFDTVVTAVYSEYTTCLSSIQRRDAQWALFLVEGEFTEHDTVTVTEQEKTKEDFDQLADSPGETLKKYFSFIDKKTLPSGYINDRLLEQWKLDIPDDGSVVHTVRYYPPEGKTEKLDIYVKTNGRWKMAETEVIGSYLAFQISGDSAEIAVLSKIPVWWIWIAAAAALLLFLLFIIKVFHKIKKKRKRRKKL